MPFRGKGGDKGNRQVYGRLHTIHPQCKEDAVTQSDSTWGGIQADTYWGNCVPARPDSGWN